MKMPPLAPYLDSHTAIVGASGAGKTVTAKNHVEALLEARRHVCVIDPTGAWYGLRSDASGEGPGFDIPILGGPHGDVAITADHGEAIGAIIAGGVSAIVDISGLRTGAEQRRFARDLFRRLRAKPDGNFHLIVDEADEFAAQKPRDDFGFQVGEDLIWMAKRGRLAGFVLTLITQRPASIDKEALSQAQTLIVHQLVAPVDQKAIVAYLHDHADKATMTAIKGSLAALERGERWLYSPRLGVLERGISPMPRTFDSSRTPAPGEQAAEPRMLASIDLGAIRAALAPVERQDSAVPSASDREQIAALRARIADLETERDALREQNEGMVAIGRAREMNIERLIAERDGALLRIEAIRRAIDAPVEIPAQGGGGPEGDQGQTEGRQVMMSAAPRAQAPAPAARTAKEKAGEGNASPAALGAERRPLASLAGVYPSGLTEAQWALAAGFKRSGGAWGTYKSRLRSAGLIEAREGRWFATEVGAAAVGTIETPPPPGAELVRWWAAKLPAVGPIAEVLIECWPEWLSRDELAARVGMAARGGSFGTYLSRLAGPGLIERDRERGVRLSAEVMR